MTVLLENRAAAHQIVIRTDHYDISVSCTCQRRKRPYGPPIQVRSLFPAVTAIAAWRNWHERRGISV